MDNIRLISRLDIKSENLIKGIHLEGLRVIGDPNEFAIKYYLEGIDELLYIDAVASLYGRNHLAEIIRKVGEDVFVPITVGGGIRSVDDVSAILRNGADKVAINTAVVKNPTLLTEISRQFGSQCVVLGIEAVKKDVNRWNAYTDNGRENTDIDVVEWVQRGVDLGAGEVLLTSVDREGTRQGFDIELVKAVTNVVDVPVIASGGMGHPRDLVSVVVEGGCNGVAVADALHYGRYGVREIRKYAIEKNLGVRRYE